MLPAEKAIGNMTASAPSTRRPPGTHLGFAERRVPEPEQVADLVHARSTRRRSGPTPRPRRRRPRESRVEEDVRLDDLAGRRVDEEVRGAEHAIEVGTVLIADDGHAVAGDRLRLSERRRTAMRGRRVVDRVPGAERPRATALWNCCGGHTGGAAIR